MSPAASCSASTTRRRSGCSTRSRPTRTGAPASSGCARRRPSARARWPCAATATATGATRTALDMPELRDCIDVDITATPFTNTLPINRLRLAPGQSADISVVYVTTPGLDISVSAQRYSRRGEIRDLLREPRPRFHGPAADRRRWTGAGLPAVVQAGVSDLIGLEPPPIVSCSPTPNRHNVTPAKAEVQGAGRRLQPGPPLSRG